MGCEKTAKIVVNTVSGRSVAWLARLFRVQEVVSSNLTAPTILKSLGNPPAPPGRLPEFDHSENVGGGEKLCRLAVDYGMAWFCRWMPFWNKTNQNITNE